MNSQRSILACRVLTTVVMCTTVAGWAAKITTAAEPNVEIASAWWPEMENTWILIGWKDHPLRFNILYNGTVIAQPVRYPARGQGVQLTFQFSPYDIRIDSSRLPGMRALAVFLPPEYRAGTSYPALFCADSIWFARLRETNREDAVRSCD